MSTSFGTGPTRQVQAGDTPDLNDGLLSRGVEAGATLLRGNACVITDGFVELATQALMTGGSSPFVTIEDGDNSGGANGDISVSGVAPNQRVALLMQASSAAIDPGQFVKPSASQAGTVVLWAVGDESDLKYARYLGKEAALLFTETGSPFKETLTPGIVPDQILTPGTDDADNVGWFQLMDSQSGATV